MGKDYQKRGKGNSGRDAGGFVALPWSVLDSANYARLSHPARALLLEFARQFVRDNNGRLLASGAYLAKRGWKSAGVIVRAKRDLLEGGFIHEMVKGQRPNKASWYAVTWQALDKLSGYDAGAAESFRRGAYHDFGSEKNASLTPSGAGRRARIVPSNGVKRASLASPNGAIRDNFCHSSTASNGDHLEVPSAGNELAGPCEVCDSSLTTSTELATGTEKSANGADCVEKSVSSPDEKPERPVKVRKRRLVTNVSVASEKCVAKPQNAAKRHSDSGTLLDDSTEWQISLKPEFRIRDKLAQLGSVLSGRHAEPWFGFDDSPKWKNLLCVGFDVLPATLAEKINDGDYQRISDYETRPGYWDDTKGEWIATPVKQSKKLKAILP